MNEIKYPSNWVIIDNIDEKNNIKNELEKELSSKHPLFGKQFTLIAKRKDDDDVLLNVNGMGYAITHLSWSGKLESTPFPETIITNSIEELTELLNE